MGLRAIEDGSHVLLPLPLHRRASLAPPPCQVPEVLYSLGIVLIRQLIYKVLNGSIQAEHNGQMCFLGFVKLRGWVVQEVPVKGEWAAEQSRLLLARCPGAYRLHIAGR
ncbi:hypothetical protein NDU88_005408 [Pleurodeles waltl]|uniref:Uncharacterized protein n=1 Tax=Pleurodeles waltl TaxID=8319 RepID=A0AAV7TAX6_PLEWA|nr:hypothetical protein NDU88_005408 [Pleurodeles waltl]